MKLPALCLFAATLAAGQVPRLGEVEIYGLHRISPDRIHRVLNLKKGDPMPPSKGDLEDRLEEIPGIVQALLEAVCCEEGRAVLFVGVEEKGGPHFAFRSEPSGEAALPADFLEKYQKFMEAVGDAARRGSTAEDLTQGHPLMADPAARELQQEFAAYARDHLALLRDVLRNGPEPESRAIAAGVIGYAPDKKAALNDLQYAMQDPDEAVRANAMRALNAIAVLAAKRPETGIRVQPTWFIEMLNSIVLGDRTRAAAILVNLTEKDTEALEQIRARALPALVEMARWHSLRYALPAYILIGRMAGLSAKEIEDTWTKGDREATIRKVLAVGEKKRTG